jgi:hypothetical protein
VWTGNNDIMLPLLATILEWTMYHRSRLAESTLMRKHDNSIKKRRKRRKNKSKRRSGRLHPQSYRAKCQISMSFLTYPISRRNESELLKLKDYFEMAVQTAREHTNSMMWNPSWKPAAAPHWRDSSASVLYLADFYAQQLLTMRPVPKLDTPLVGIPRLLIQYR